jgi:ribosome-binding protein aMBF1 (putative translation factor)
MNKKRCEYCGKKANKLYLVKIKDNWFYICLKCKPKVKEIKD